MDEKTKRHPAEDAYLTNPIASATEATGCAPIPDTERASAPVKGTKLPGGKRKKK